MSSIMSKIPHVPGAVQLTYERERANESGLAKSIGRSEDSSAPVTPQLRDSSARQQQIYAGLFIGVTGEEVLEGQWFGDPDKDLSAGASDKEAGRLVLNQRRQSK